MYFLFYFLVKMTINVKLLRNLKDCLHQHLQKQVPPVGYQVQSPVVVVVVVVLLMCTIKNVYHEHLLRVKILLQVSNKK